ncbi:hypothetical protein AOQ84DRAFT_438081 [Glonium stellatum]|uniref:Zn(2)-C6 fungal-type domain-containing protein n=1 Tax=Glonium stellatum TaxID=574774 RepID=A0A8E2F5U9_9PEZI|nr:hypothetical protein AOQ84DRAFT_438081 [Glonium stellatum]
MEPIEEATATTREKIANVQKRQRRKTPKVRSGCITCKIRRIKCDEGKPSCLKCSSTGRKCDGYTSHPGSNHNTAIDTAHQTATTSDVGLPMLLLGVQPHINLPPYRWNLTEPEKRSIHHFVHRSTKDLTGPFQTQVWGSYALSLCATSPAIQHAVIALSGFHERFCSPITAVASLQGCLQHYHKAVKRINSLMDEHNHKRNSTIQEIVVACAIFICIEILIGNDVAALTHLEGGLGILRQIFSTETSSTSLTPDPQVLDLRGLFARLDLQALSFVGSRPSMEPLRAPTPLPNPPASSLYRVLRRAHHFLRTTAEPLKYTDDIPSVAFQERELHLADLESWYQAFKSQRTYIKTPENIANLLVAYHSTRIKLLVCLGPFEIAYDACSTNFRAIVEAADCILASRLPSCLSGDTKYFTLEASIIEPLYFTSLKCRHPQLRRRALSLLHRSGKEGVWDGSVMAEIADFIISIEDGGTDDSQYISDELCVEESKRVHGTAVQIDRVAKTVDVKCSLRSESGVWRFRSAVLTW